MTGREQIHEANAIDALQQLMLSLGLGVKPRSADREPLTLTIAE